MYCFKLDARNKQTYMGSNRSLQLSNVQEMVGRSLKDIYLEVMPILSSRIPIIKFSLKRAKGSIC